MASLQVVKSNLSSPFLGFRPNLQQKSWVGSDLTPSEKRILKLQSRRRLRFSLGREFRVCCRVREDEGESKGEEPPESLFMKELRRRGMTPTSILEETNKSMYEVGEEAKVKEGDERGFSKRSAVSTDFDIGRLSNQRETSMALNSEGLEGLIPRAKLLLTLGGTFFLGFWPLILTTVALFSALYLYFGPAFVHDATTRSMSPPPYVDPYVLLEEERLSQAARDLK